MRDLSQLVYAVGRMEAGSIRLLGTAFAISSTKIATAFHVVGADDRNLVLVLPKIASMNDFQDTSDSSVSSAPLQMTAADPVRDLCVLTLAVEIVNFPKIGSADDAPTGSTVATLGFPHANKGRMVLTHHQTQVGARIFIESDGQKVKHLVLNSLSREGQSGGPVLDLSMKTVVAVLVGSYAHAGGGGISLGGIDPATLHQTTHAVSAEYLRDMV